MKCSELGEFKLIARLSSKLKSGRGVVVGIGDDTAVLRSSARDRYLLFTTDTVVEGVHFTFRSRGAAKPATPYHVGWKALARNLSDIAAMGGIPRWAVVSIGLPAATDVRAVDGIYRGLAAAASKFETAIVGGDTSRTDGPLFVSVALVGEVEKNRLKLRSSAKDGDMVFVTGVLGGSRLGHNLTFTPRIAEARWLVGNFPVNAMMDISDGLAGDLRRLTEASKVGFNILADSIPVSSAARQLSKRDRKSPLEHAWADGEDFELLFTLPAKNADTLLKRWYAKFNLQLTPIGVVTSKRGKIRVLGMPGILRLEKARGYEHFRKQN